MIKLKKIAFVVTLSALISLQALAQKINEPKDVIPEWSQPYKSFRIVGNLYYVGTYDLACYLIVTPKGNILINTGLAASAPIIKNNIKTLGFKLTDIKILLTTQAHYDHVGAMTEIKKLTGASMWANSKDVEALNTGGKTDYELGKYGVSFKPVKVDKQLVDGDTITLGDTELVMLHHPGHTKGSSSYLFNVTDENKTYKVLIVNMPSIITDTKFSDLAVYPDIAKDYAYTFNALKNLSFDLWLSSHGSQFNFHAKHKPNDEYNPESFNDREGYDKTVHDLEVIYLKKMEQELIK